MVERTIEPDGAHDRFADNITGMETIYDPVDRINDDQQDLKPYCIYNGYLRTLFI